MDDTSTSGTRNDNVPGDGKYDQSILPSAVELEIGRVDLSNMTIFPDASTSENDLLLRYLSRNHDCRHLLGNYSSVPRRGLIDDHWGYRGNDTFASNAWWNFTSFMGTGNISEGDWFTTLNTDVYLWAFGGGGGTYTSANGVGLANMWTGRSHWHIHPMAMGECLGAGTRRSQNNIGAYPAGGGVGQVHVALMGDPTLRLFPVIPPSGLAHVATSGKVALSWSASF